MAFRVSFILGQTGDRAAGFTENFWLNTFDASVADLACQTMLPVLKGLHGDQTVIQAYRPSPVETKRLSKLVRTVDSAKVVGGTNDSDYMATAAKLSLDGTGGYTTTQWIKGIPDRVVKNGGRLVMDTDYDAAWKKFRAMLLGTRSHPSIWCLRVLDKTVAPKRIEGIDPAGVVTITAHGFINGQLVKIGGLNPPVGSLIPRGRINKVWEVIGATADTFKLYGYPAATQAVLTDRAYAKKIVYSYPAIVDASMDFATSHKVGGPLLVVGGKRKKK